MFFDYILFLSNFDFKRKKNKIFKNYTKKKNYNIILLIVCCILFHFNNLWLQNFNKKNKTFKEIYYAGVFLLIDSIFFKKNILSHHILSNMIMIIISLIIYFFYFYRFFNSIIYFFSIILESYCYSFHYLLIYYLNSSYFINVFLMGSIIGASELIYNMIVNQVKNNKITNGYPFLIFIFIIKFFYHFLYFLIIYKISPIHAFLCYSISSTLFSFMFINGEIFYISLGFILIISFMIYLEIVEIQCFGLNKNIKNKIIERSNREAMILLKDLRVNNI